MTTTLLREHAVSFASSRAFGVHVVSADPRARRLLRHMLRALGYEVQSFGDAHAFLAGGLARRPDCVVLDGALPGRMAPELQRAAQQATVRVPVVFFGDAQVDVATAVQAMKSGAIDFLCAPISPTDLGAAIASAVTVATQWQREDLRRRRAIVLADRLTPRERAVFALVLEGKLNKQIAALLDSQEATVKVHRSRLMRKLEVRSLAELLDLGRELDRDVLRQEARACVVPLDIHAVQARGARSENFRVHSPLRYGDGEAA
jgi:FixJ family two-component response regulator